MYIHHSLEEKKEIIRLYELGASMSELMNRYHVRDHYLHILFGRYEKYGMDGLEKYKERRITNTLKRSVIEEYEKDCLPLWRICVEYDVSYSCLCRWVQLYKHGGYEELLCHGSRGQPRKDMGRPRKKEPQTELKCTPKVRQKTFGVYYVKKKESWLCRVLEVHAYDRRWKIH